MIKNSRKHLQQKLVSVREQATELSTLRGQNMDASKHILDKVVVDRKRYETSISTFNQVNDKITHLGKKLLRHLSLSYLDNTLAESRQAMGGSWTTVGLDLGMRNLMKRANNLATHINNEGLAIKKLADNVYKVFQTNHGFEVFNPPELDMSNFTNNISALEKITTDFCTDPINVLTEKHFLIRKFFLGLGMQIQKIFELAEKDCQRWLEVYLAS